jgi:hypothetical protein
MAQRTVVTSGYNSFQRKFHPRVRAANFPVKPWKVHRGRVRELFDKNVETLLRILHETDLPPLLYDSHRDGNDLP